MINAAVLKKFSAFVICLLMITVCMFVTGAEASTYSGTCGFSLKWSLDTSTGLLTISGTGAMTNYTYSSHSPWYSYDSYITSLVIESGATSMGNYAFFGCNCIRNAEIPDTVVTIVVETIGDYAFKFIMINIKMKDIYCGN